MWESTVRLVGDDEAAHKALTQLKKAIRSRVTETELPDGSQLQLVSLTTSTVTAQLEQLAAVSGDTDQQRRHQEIKGKARKRSYRGTRKGPPARPEKAVEEPSGATRSQVPGVVCYAIRQGLLHKRGAYGGRRA